MALAIALVMCMSMMSMVAFAAPAADGSLEIDNAIKDESYTLYKIFDLTYGTGGTSTTVSVPTDDAQNAIAGTYQPVAYTYTKGSDDGFFTALSAATDYFTVTQVGTSDVYTVVRKMNNETPATPVKSDADVIAWMKDNVSKLPSDRTISTIKATGTSVKWSDLAYGYYYAESSAGSLVTIDSTLKDVVVKEKNTIPTDDKKVQDSDEATETWGTKDDAQIGDTVNFKLTVTDGKGTDGYIVLHDTMSTGLTLDISSFVVKKGTDAVDTSKYKIYVDKDLTTTGTATSDIDKTVDISETDITDGAATPTTLHKKDTDTFVIVFDKDYVKGLNESDVVTITYSAVLNDTAVVGTSETNKSKITYSNQTSTEHSTTVDTYNVEILKYANDATTTPIADAVFQLQKADGTALWLTPGTTKTGYDVYEIAQNQNPDLTGLTEVKDTRDSSITIGYKDGDTWKYYKAFVTTAGNKVQIDGLDVDKTYKLEELEAPNGYNKLTEKKDIAANNDKTDFVDLSIQNLSGTELPSTGGIGTTIFYVIGAVLVIGAGVLLVTRRRMRAE